MSDFIIETEGNQPLQVVEQKLVINEIAGNIIHVDEENIKVSLGETKLQIISVGSQGPQGPQGVPGSGAVTSAVAGEIISGTTAVVIINGQLFEADPTNASHAPLVIGIADQSGMTGSTVIFQQSGILNAGVNIFTTGSRYFVGVGGVLSTQPWQNGFAWTKCVGTAISTSSIIINMEPSILL